MNGTIKKIHTIVASLASAKNGTSDCYDFGFEYFGPFLYGYTNWLCKEIKKGKYQKVFFFSRDGFMMDKAFHYFNYNNIIEQKYIYLSRKSIRQALLNKCTSYEDSLKYLTWERFISFGKLLEYYGFSSKEKKQISKKFNISLEYEFSYSEIHSSKKLKSIYEFLKAKIDVNSIKQEHFLKKYLIQVGLKGKCAIVDIGWHGSMQFYLEKFITINKIQAELEGYYVGINSMVSLSGKVHGYIYDNKNLHFRKSILCFFGGYERLFQSCEGSTNGYLKQKEIIIPDLGLYEYDDKEILKNIKEWQSGAIDFIKEAKIRKIQLTDDKEWAYPLIRVGKNPTLKEVGFFKSFYTDDGTKSYFVSQKPLYRYKLKELIHALSNSVWKTGFMKSVFKLPLPYYKIYELMRR